MWIFHGVRLLPPVHTPPGRWLEMPLVTTVPLYDDAGIAYANDLALTEGFYTLVGVYCAWRVVLGTAAVLWRLQHNDDE